MRRGTKSSGSSERNELYTRAVAECGRMLDRLSFGYEADPDKRRDLRQEIHLQLWRSFGAFGGRCSLKTWTLRVAHNTAASYVIRERRMNAKLRTQGRGPAVRMGASERNPNRYVADFMRLPPS
jgi:DNA-directed RNA polymerase specialized sigma24 family protein